MRGIVAAAAPGETHALPVSRLITGAAKALGINKRFQANHRVTITGDPIGFDATHDQAQNMVGQAAHLHPGQHQKPGVVSGQLQMALPSRPQPICSSRACTDHADEPNSRLASARSWLSNTKYFMFSPTQLV